MAAAKGHKDRGHAILGPSSAKRWMTCTPSARLETNFPNKGSVAADEGTLAHELAEGKLRRKFTPDLYSSRKLTNLRKKCMENPLWKDEMDACTDKYVEKIYEDALGFKTMPMILIEEQLDLSGYIPEGFGTCDCALIGDNKICVYDYKHGKGVRVDADHNTQEYIYALGVLAKYGWMANVETVQLGIIQPRIPDGITTYECSLQEVLDFGENLKPIALKAFKGEGEQVCGDHCRFCRARAVCRARAQQCDGLAQTAGVMPPYLDDKEVGWYLTIGKKIAKWVEELEEYALEKVLNGEDIPGWKAIEGKGGRDWTDVNEAFDIILKAGEDIYEDDLWEKKPITVAQAEKLLGDKKFFELVGSKVQKYPGKPKLAPESDKKPAVTRTSVEDAFGATGGDKE